MALFVLNSVISIGRFTFRGVHEVRIKRSMNNYTDTASITLPSICRVVRGNSSMPVDLVTGTLFSEGDAGNIGDKVVIKLGYNGNLKTEFEGYVKRRDLAMPLVVDCEGYVKELRQQVSYSADYSKVNTSAKQLLLNATASTDSVKVMCPVDFPISGITLDKADGLRICDWIKEASDHSLTLFFIQPDVLWCGLVYTPYAEGNDPFWGSDRGHTANYRLGYNCVKDNGIKVRIPSEPVQIIMHGKLTSGVSVKTASKAAYAVRKVKSLINHVPDVNTVKSYAQEKEYTLNYKGYEGKINAFLEPYCLPGWKANVVDTRFPELNGSYLVVSTEVTFGVRGARRAVELGPRIGFAK